MTAKKVIHLGTRGSRLAIIQSEYVKRRIEAMNPDVDIRLVTIKTTADKFQTAPLYRMGGKGLFLKEIEDALLEGKVDLAVHSMKDVPSEIPEGLEIAAITERMDPRDALVSKESLQSVEGLPQGARVATSSLRRASQLLHVRPDLEIIPIRGNQDTRIKKMTSENLDAVVLAMAGILRMNFKDIHLLPLDTNLCLPAAGQGSLGVEARREDAEIRNLVSPLNDSQASACIRAERACLLNLGAECYTSMAAFAEINPSGIGLRAVVADLTGKKLLKDDESGDMKDPESIGTALAERLFSRGAKEIIEAMKQAIAH